MKLRAVDVGDAKAAKREVEEELLSEYQAKLDTMIAKRKRLMIESGKLWHRSNFEKRMNLITEAEAEALNEMGCKLTNERIELDKEIKKWAFIIVQYKMEMES